MLPPRACLFFCILILCRPMAHTKRREYRYYITCRICGKQFRNLGWSHLRLHKTTTEKYKKKYRVDYVYSEHLRKSISEGKTTKTRRSRYRPRSRKGIIRALRRYAAKQRPLTCPWLEKRDVNLVKQALYAFGSWYDALDAAGLHPRRFRRWSERKVIDDIRRRGRAGESLRLSVVQREDRYLYGAARNRFGSWRGAVEKSGFAYAKITGKKTRSREAVTRDLKAWARTHGSLQAKTMREKNRPLLEAVYRRFGSLESAAKKLRLPYSSRTHRWSKQEVLRQMRGRKRLAKSLQARPVALEDNRLYQAARKHFGSWPAAMNAVGVDYRAINRHRSRTRETIGRDLRAWSRKHGALSCRRLGETDKALLAAVYRVIGSPKKAARIFGLRHDDLRRNR